MLYVWIISCDCFLLIHMTEPFTDTTSKDSEYSSKEQVSFTYYAHYAQGKMKEIQQSLRLKEEFIVNEIGQFYRQKEELGRLICIFICIYVHIFRNIYHSCVLSINFS
jgi:hypothetical protein